MEHGWNHPRCDHRNPNSYILKLIYHSAKKCGMDNACGMYSQSIQQLQHGLSWIFPSVALKFSTAASQNSIIIQRRNYVLYSRYIYKRNTPIYFNTNYCTEMKLVPVIMDYCLLQFEVLKFFLGVHLHRGLNLTLIFLM